MGKKELQVPVVVGVGSEQFFIEKEIKVSPPSPPIFEIKEIKKWVEVYDVKVIPGKVIFNAYLWKDINYKTVEHVHDDSVNGPLFHLTTKIPFGGFVPICPAEGEKVCPGDTPELIEAFVEGEIDDLQCKTIVCGVPVFEKLLEKSVVRVTFKVVRVQHVMVDDFKDDKCKDFDKFKEKDFDKCKDKDKDKDDKFCVKDGAFPFKSRW
ncbi:MAG TPA: DUF3794 domain-containing protein [Thermoclostridium sp.]|nr:DUF3794 domain-containing protein [Clostridiaceae bacterium]HOQ75712.1 DUF3794 domain-containing protein [Thermoclostridium sp.]HPU45325.1 DUF3794 domain-containing protein [Thermoclostridium sp.]